MSLISFPLTVIFIMMFKYDFLEYGIIPGIPSDTCNRLLNKKMVIVLIATTC